MERLNEIMEAKETLENEMVSILRRRQRYGKTEEAAGAAGPGSGLLSGAGQIYVLGVPAGGE